MEIALAITFIFVVILFIAGMFFLPEFFGVSADKTEAKDQDKKQ
ncbi:hypothetical protein [Pseudobdellovibrio sp. HCB154]